jgi:uncharacterized lipoprotein YmbA
MTRARRRCRWFALGLTTIAGACGSPAPVLYTIAPAEGVAHIAGPRVIVLQQVGIERYLDRSQIVRSSENYRLDVMANDWWGEPLAAMLDRMLATELAQRFPQSTVLRETGVVTSSPDATVEVNVQRLDEDAAGSVVLSAQAGVRFKGEKASAVQTFHFVVVPPGPGIPGQVAATSTGLGQLADGIAAMLLAPPGAR